MKNLEETLIDIGFSEKEAQVYLALLSLGKANAYQVAVKSGLKKPTSYLILEELHKKGYVVLVPREKKKQYLPVQPEELYSRYKEKLSLFEKSLPELLAIKRSTEDKPVFTIYDGKDACLRIGKQLYKDHKGESIYGMYARAEGLSSEDITYYKELSESISNNKILAHIVVPETEVSLQVTKLVYDNSSCHVKVLPIDIYSTVNAIEIFSDMVTIESVGKYQVTLIENADYANTMKQLFFCLFTHSRAKDFKK